MNPSLEFNLFHLMQAGEIESFANKTKLLFWSYPEAGFQYISVKYLLELIILPAFYHQGLLCFFSTCNM